MAIDNMQTQLVLAQNQHAFIQDSTKGTVQVYSGPHMVALNQTDRPVVYNRKTDRYEVVTLDQAIQQNPVVGEGEYIVLENPVFSQDGARLQTPTKGGETPPTLLIGRKVNIPGPVTFPLWPGQSASPVSGHHLRSNQYLVVRVYNAEEAGRNATGLLESSGVRFREAADSPLRFTPGQLIVIKGTEASFFIPPTGFEVLRDGQEYVREALTLERLEYCILLDEDGNKRYERGPQVVFPEATERFVTRNEEKDQGGKSRKFKAIELNDQMGLYVKVIADYDEAVNTTDEHPAGISHHVTGEELFITGAEQRIYYPRPEHALIGYDDPKSGFKRERYYGVTIPKGEGRYVLDKMAGDIRLVTGPQIFLPDPRNQVIVRRVLDQKTTALWYPGNLEAEAFNASLRALSDSGTILADSAVQQAAADVSRSMNRMTSANVSYNAMGNAGAFAGVQFSRGGKFTPPPMLTLSNKYDGVPAINVWTGYAVQVVDRTGQRRVVVGPATVLLQYDETLEMLTLSTGRPKTTDALLHDVYLRVDNNIVSDLVQVETKDLVVVQVKLSYRVNFLREHQDRWFAVENYVKYLCDHMRSLLKAAAKRVTIREFVDDGASIVRTTVLGERAEYVGPDTGAAGDASSTKVQRHRLFQENGMDVYDVEVLGVQIPDNKVAGLLVQAQTRAVEAAITLTMDEQLLENQRRKTEIAMEMADLGARQTKHAYDVQRANNAAKAAVNLADLEAEYGQEARRVELAARNQEAEREAELAAQDALDDIAAAALARRKAEEEQDALVRNAEVEAFKARVAAVTPQLIQAMQTLGDKNLALQLSRAIAPLALHEQQGLAATLDRVFAGTPLEQVLRNLQMAEVTGKGDDEA